ncbi:DUF4189 domain-containing protein [Stenotrophomonas sp. ZAC14D2_NAIMI4_7]|uniref:DUF4189 domain-containing protein n=1 Tax=Stenotrophomonas sp. ZAC14D2_NAIMI4_7 TaxID=2072405 RepID=UPI002D79C33F|nr:DUF4189 domain-containing protein [Stenotrophomonas sp. ZAC14D2_NAIMI4_7]
MIRRILVAVLMIGTGGSGTTAHAEGGCPPGSYPIGGQGVQGCAPIPGAGGGQSGSSIPTPPRPTGRWHDAWGAIAHSKSTSVVGTASAETSRRSAERTALKKCAVEGAKDCAVVMAYTNQCFAWVIPNVGGPGAQSGMARAATMELANELAQKECKDGAGDACKPFYSDCAEPTFERL